MSQIRPIVTYETLARAIKNRMEVSEDVADDISFRVLNYFGFDDEIIDNVLDQDDRRMFYFLQDVQILTTHWEEAILPTGRTWRVFYWGLNVEKIMKYAAPPQEEETIELGIYDSLPQTVWSRSAA
ncbi:MAG: hypothetical protein ISF22_07640 [Methanomassiliicoccus sp.]|nr:hypothetical protein [Methanomassiliicoccus sp.]